MRTTSSFLASLLVSARLLGLPAAVAQDTPSPTAPLVAEPRPASVRSEGPDATLLISLDFHEADIRNVLRIFAEKSGVNVIAGKEVQGTVTIRLINVPWEHALDVLLKTYGFTYERDGNIIRVTTFEQMKQEELETGVFVLNYAEAKELVESIADVLTERGTVKADERTNMIVAKDIPTNLYRVRQLVERLDRRTPQVAIDTKIVETALDDDENLGISWTIKATLKGGIRPTTFPFNKISSGGTFGSLFYPKTAGQSSFPPAGSEGQFPFAAKSDFTFGTLDMSSLQAILELLKTRTNTSIVSNPRITTLNNQKATIHVGEIFNVPTFERNETTGNFEVTGFEERDIGINLEVTPHVNDAGEIVVDLHPEVTDFKSFDTFSGDLQAPRFDTREANTQVRVRSGETIAIGGLVKDKFVDTTIKVPVLGDIPGLGALFRKTEKAKDKTDLIFFITVHLVNDRPAALAGAPAPAGATASSAASQP